MEDSELIHLSQVTDESICDAPGRLAQWTSSALSTPDGLKHVLANRVITCFVRLGEKELPVSRRGLATSNNVGVVYVEPADDGGHVVTLTVHQYDPKHNRLLPALSDVAAPARHLTPRC